MKSFIDFITQFIQSLMGKNQDIVQNWYNDESSEDNAQRVPQDTEATPIPAIETKISISYPVELTHVTSHYGWRNLNGNKNWHTGVDYTGKNKNAVACFNGTITKILQPDLKYPVKFKWSNTARKFVRTNYPKGRAWTPYCILVADHDPNLRAIYKHVRTTATIGQFVRYDDVIATLGNYGYSMGSHLHFEIQIKKKNKWTRVNPEKFLKKNVNA